MDMTYLLASLVWGSIGLGLVMYGRKQTAAAPLGAGALLLIASYFADSALSMSVVSLVVLAVLSHLSKR